MEAVLCHGESHNRPFFPHTFTCNCSLQGVIELVQDFWSLGPLWDSSHISCYFHMSWRSCSFGFSGPAPSHTPTDHRWDRCWWTNSEAWVWAWVVGSGSACQLSPVLTTMVNSLELPQSIHPVQSAKSKDRVSPPVSVL